MEFFGADLTAAVAYGVHAGSYAVARPGAQASYARIRDLGAVPGLSTS